MGLKTAVDKIDEVDEKYRDLYTEKDGKFLLTGVDGMKTQEDINKLQGALVKERNDHKQARDKLSAWGDHKPDEVLAQLDRIPELEAAAAGKLDETKINGIVETRVRQKLAPVERERDQLRTQLGEKDKTIEGFTKKERTRAIHDAVRTAASSAKVRPEAMDDALMLAERVFDVDDNGSVVTKDNVGVTPGVQPSVWLTELQSKRPHWWGESVSGGAPGNRSGSGTGNNPFTHEHWNLTEQGRILKENRSKAEQLAKSAGTTIGGQRPAPKK